MKDLSIMNKTHPIRAARQQAGMTQQALADALKTTKGAVSAWEVWRAQPKPDHALHLSRILPLTLEQIYASAA